MKKKYLQRRVGDATRKSTPEENRSKEEKIHQKEVDDFIHAVAHELRTPLRFINKLAQLLLSDSASILSPEALDRAEMIVVATRQTGKLLDDFLALSRTAQQPLESGPVDMGELARSVIVELTDHAEGSHIRTDVGDIPSSEGDLSLLRLVLLNLIGNAFKFTRSRLEAIVEIGCNTDNGRCVYFVRDNGVGFDNTHADELFDVFTRLHQSEDFEGTGVGLSLVKRIIERHNGSVWAEGELDNGATFYFTLGQPTIMTETVPPSNEHGVKHHGK